MSDAICHIVRCYFLYRERCLLLGLQLGRGLASNADGRRENAIQDVAIWSFEASKWLRCSEKGE